ncbi:MAG: TolC family protein [Sedimentisphaerales bacterium]|nr:TolC family protein [Sedimentisphaerales bacterium]
MQRKAVHISLVIVSYLIFISGCSSFNGQEVRREDAEDYTKQLAVKTREVLDGNQPLDLYDCIRISMENNLSLRSAEIQQRIAKLEQKVSFSNFLPAVSLGYDKTWWDPLPQINFGGTGIPMHDKDVREVTWNVQLSIFNPATWFLYSMHTRGYEIAELVTEYTSQAIALQVTAQYYQCLSLEQTIAALESQLAAAQAVEKELSALEQEGMVSSWQAEQGRVMVLARRTQLTRVRKSLEQSKAELLTNMGLDPTSGIQLKLQTPFDAPDDSLEGLITAALLNHPSLAIADRQVAIEKEKIKTAVAAFLPRLNGFALRMDTTDSHQIFTNYWLGGLSAAITVFDGFTNVYQHKAAKESHKDALVRRQQATLTLMLQVIRASDQVQLAQDQMELARRINQVSSKHLAEIKQQYEQGLVQAGEMLKVTAEANNTEIQYLQSRFQYQSSIAVLANVMGETQVVFSGVSE